MAREKLKGMMASNGKQGDEPSGPNTPEDDKRQYHNISDDENAHELLRMIVRSVEVKERQKSSHKAKRKRHCLRKPPQNGSDADDENTAYSRCTISFFVKVLERVKSVPQYVQLVKWMGFGDLLELVECVVPRGFVQWVADNVQAEEEVIRIGSRTIDLTADAVADTLGTPSGEMIVDSDEVAGKAAFLGKFGLTEVPSFRYVGKKILGKELLPDDVFCQCFMGVALACFLCPNSNTKLSTKYMGALIVVENIKDRNWSKFIHNWLIEYIKKYLKEPLKHKKLSHTLGGCIYHLAVRLLDFVDFGAIQLPPTLPRIRVWKGNLIKLFSEMFIGTNGKYGAYPIRELSQTCYSRLNNEHKGSKIPDESVKASIETAIGDLVSLEVREKISTAFISTVKNKSESTQLEVQELVVHIVRAILLNGIGSQETEKLPSTQEDEGSSHTIHETSTTSVVRNSTHQRSEDGIDDSPLRHRKRRRNEPDDILQQPNAPTYMVANQQSVIPEARDPMFMPKQSMSLEHMIPLLVSQEDNKPFEEKEVSMDLNRNIMEAEDENFSFVNSHIQQNTKTPTVEVQNDVPEPPINDSKMDVDVNLPSSSNNVHQTKPLKRSEYLQAARFKYYWNDPSMPAFRFSEDEDDHGKSIEEPELYRPLGMDDLTYNRKIADAVVDWELREIEEEKGSESPIESKHSTPKHKWDSPISEHETSIQCAQKEPSATGLTNSRKWEYVLTNQVVDLVTPEPKYTSQEHIKATPSCSTSGHKADLSKVLMVGRKLFHSNDDNSNSSGNKSNIRNFIDITSEESPEVEVLKEKVFKVTCNQMSRNVDEIYNTTLSLGNNRCFQGKENERPQRLINRSRFITSPYDAPHKVTVLPIHQKVWEAVTTLCDSPNQQITWAINIDGVKVSMIQLGKSMKLNGKVEAWVINAFCRKLFRDRHPRISNKHYFFNTVSEYFLQKWKNNDAKLIFKQRAIDSFKGAASARELHECDRLVFPSLNNDHWFCFVVDFKIRNFVFLDSVFGEDSTFHKQIWKMMISNFIQVWYEAGQKNVRFYEFGKIYPNVPKQKPGYDCGIFTMKFMELFDPRNPMQCSFSNTDVPCFRIRYAHDMVMTIHNKEEDAKFLVCQ